MLFSMDFSHLVESDCEKKRIGITDDVHFITHIHAMKCAFELQNRWSHSQPLSSKVDGPTVSLGGVHLSDILSNATMRQHLL